MQITGTKHVLPWLTFGLRLNDARDRAQTYTNKFFGALVLQFGTAVPAKTEFCTSEPIACTGSLVAGFARIQPRALLA